MLSYNGDSKFKAKFVELTKAHLDADRLTHQTYGTQTVSDAQTSKVLDRRQHDKIIETYEPYALVDGTVLEWKGCAVACGYASYMEALTGRGVYGDNAKHQELATGLGLPVELIYYEDAIFETLDVRASMQWPQLFAEAVPVGAELVSVLDHFEEYLHELGVDEEYLLGSEYVEDLGDTRKALVEDRDFRNNIDEIAETLLRMLREVP